ncbi:two component transcriptional regulator, LuxR family [Bifidobacterium margollesii]|uniref:Two component transcriptional regulator, LuxR family n=1 Tax=Bifidobacterium margollesii TaxID=2020964 RepID=A0A2N5J9K7_9BIFI|nr:response regulator transcription factor [Bifidobacterium margollesii]PLS30890.1 two component transcriptional regulator, LuxR family [Bifidobacterium margollesii]
METTATTAMTLVAAVDNDTMALLALQGILPQLLPGARWLWGVGSASEAVDRALDPETRPRLLLVDMSLDDGTGIGVVRRIRERTDRVAMLAVTAFDVSTYAARAAQAGAQGIVSKANMSSLATALRTVATGGTYCPQELGAPEDSRDETVDPVMFIDAASARLRLLRARGERIENGMKAGSPMRRSRLSPKESETMRLLSRGLSYEQIAARGNVSTATVRTYAHRSVTKLGASSLAHAIALYLEG